MRDSTSVNEDARRGCGGESVSEEAWVNVEFEHLERAVEALALGIDAAECHGTLTGHLLSTPWTDEGFPEQMTVESWVLGLLETAGRTLTGDDALGSEDGWALRVLEELWRDTVVDLSDDTFGFVLLLPDDERPIGVRSRAIGQWAGGFLSGLGEGGALAGVKLSEEAEELIRDFSEVARIEPMPAADEESEAALMEISEYVKGGVLMIAAELGAAQRLTPPDAGALH